MAERTRQILFLFVALLFALLAVFYYFYLTPMQEKKKQRTVELAQLRATVQGMTEQKQNQQNERTVSEQKLARVAEAIPVTPYTDQLIKDLGKLQTISNVEILSATFSEQKAMSAKEIAEKIIARGDEGWAESGEADADGEEVADAGSDEDAGVEGDAGTATKANEGTKAPPSVETIKRFLPETTLGSVEITLSMKAQYEELYRFLTEVQDLSRYLRVDEISVTSDEKDEFTVSADDKMTATVKLTSYYAPEFRQLVGKPPAVDVDAPSGKGNPFEYGTMPKPADEADR